MSSSQNRTTGKNVIALIAAVVCAAVMLISISGKISIPSLAFVFAGLALYYLFTMYSDVIKSKAHLITGVILTIIPAVAVAVIKQPEWLINSYTVTGLMFAFASGVILAETIKSAADK